MESRKSKSQNQILWTESKLKFWNSQIFRINFVWERKIHYTFPRQSHYHPWHFHIKIGLKIFRKNFLASFSTLEILEFSVRKIFWISHKNGWNFRLKTLHDISSFNIINEFVINIRWNINLDHGKLFIANIYLSEKIKNNKFWCWKN